MLSMVKCILLEFAPIMLAFCSSHLPQLCRQNRHIPNNYKKLAILKKGIGIESQNLCKQFNDQKTIQTRWNSTVAIEQEVYSKAFAIPILTARL